MNRFVIVILVALLLLACMCSRAQAQYHSHRCSVCGNTWTHGEENVGHLGPHICRVCGNVQYQRYYGVRPAMRFFRQPTYAPRYTRPRYYYAPY